MSDTDPLANSQQQRTSTSPQTTGNTAQPGKQVSPPAEDAVPLFDIIESCLEEFPALRKIMPSRHATACLMSGAGQESIEDSTGFSENFLRHRIDHFVQKGHAVLIIEDIDAMWYQALAARFPESLDVRFLAQHVLRQGELRATYDYTLPLYDEYRTLVSRVDAEISRRLSGTSVQRDHRSRHIDGQISRYIIKTGRSRRTDPTADGYRKEVLEFLKRRRSFQKTSTRLSYCHVHENLTLFLVDAGPQSVGSLQFSPDLELWPSGASGHVVPMSFVKSLFEYYTVDSVFADPEVRFIELMMSAAAYQAIISRLELKIVDQRLRAAQDDIEQAFSMLTDLRHELTITHQRMAKTSSLRVDIMLLLEDSSWLSPAEHTQTSAEDTTFGSKDAAPKRIPATGSRSPKAADINKLSETFSELDARLRAMIAALNDDIQVVIGSVQIQDAKAMKRQADLTMQLTETTMRQTEVSIRQTRWTVALAILAAFYLPMTLVTGIYGMNIKEISGDKGPNWWWVVVTWAITMGITVGCVGRYALVEWQWYRHGMQATEVAAKGGPPDDIPRDEHHGMVESTSGEAEDTGCLSITRRNHLWRKLPPNAQPNGTRSTV